MQECVMRSHNSRVSGSRVNLETGKLLGVHNSLLLVLYPINITLHTLGKH